MINRLKNKLVSHLFCSINPTDVISVDKGITFLGNEVITNEEIHQLQEEIKYIESCRVWGIITNTLRQETIERGLTKSLSFQDVLTAKAMLINLDVIQNIFRTIKNKK
jgi:hypothetical protein